MEILQWVKLNILSISPIWTDTLFIAVYSVVLTVRSIHTDTKYSYQTFTFLHVLKISRGSKVVVLAHSKSSVYRNRYYCIEKIRFSLFHESKQEMCTNSQKSITEVRKTCQTSSHKYDMSLCVSLLKNFAMAQNYLWYTTIHEPSLQYFFIKI